MESLNWTSMTNDTNLMAHDNVPAAPLRTLTPDGFVHGIVAFIALAKLIGLPGNVLVVLVHRRIKSPTATDWVVFYLAACDICSLVVCGPSYILTMTKLWNLFMPSFLCSFHFTILHSFFLASTSLITVVAVVRRSVMNNNREPISARTSKIDGAIVIFVSIGLGSPSFILTKNTPSGFCYYVHEKAQLQIIVYGVYLLIILIFNAITCVSYVSIIPKLRNAARFAPTDSNIINSAFVRTRRAATKATICLALVSVVFLFSTAAPLTVVTVLNASNHNVGVAMDILIFFFSRLYFINTFVNPLIYFWVNSVLRQRVRSLFQRNSVTSIQ